MYINLIKINNEYFLFFLFQTPADGNCLLTSILYQLARCFKDFNADDLRLMGANHGVFNYKLYTMTGIHRMYDPDTEEISFGQFIEEFLVKNSWVDTRYLPIYVRMFKVGISLVTPYMSKPIPFFHNKEDPEIVIAANGGTEESRFKTTHFIATRSK